LVGWLVGWLVGRLVNQSVSQEGLCSVELISQSVSQSRGTLLRGVS